MRLWHKVVLIGLTSLLTSSALAQWEFNWVPSGTLDVGDRDSEAAAHYEADGERVEVQLGYRDTPAKPEHGRKVTSESFVIRPASYRLGPSPANLVIVATVDSANVPGPLTVIVGGEEIGTWTIAKPAGSRRLFDAYFAIPRTIYERLPGQRPPGELPVVIRSDQPRQSLGYRFFATRDWDVLGYDLAGDLGAAIEATANDAKRTYLQAWQLAGDHAYAAAIEKLAPLANGEDDLAALARVARRLFAAKQLIADSTQIMDFETHYRLGLLAGAWGAWPEARTAFRRAVSLDPAHADATYRYAEAIEYCRAPVETFAPLFERSGFLGEAQNGDANVEDLLLGVYPFEIEGFCSKLSQAQMTQMQRDWRYVEQMIYGASLGRWRVDTTYFVQEEHDPEWVMQAGWIFLPPDEAVAYEGKYDYSIGTAGYGSSHAGGVDCGVAGSGGAQIGPTRGWEVWLHEWNHQFDWVFLFAESGPGYPVTHDSDGCGKQPIVSMGCGHRSSMYYYVTPMQYKRHRASDPVEPAAFIADWQVRPAIDIGPTELPAAEELIAYMRANTNLSQQEIDTLEAQWKNAKAMERRREENPLPVPLSPEPKPIPDWDGFVQARWLRVSKIDEITRDDHDAYVAGQMVSMPAGLQTITASGDFVDGQRAWPDAGPKSIGYARTFVYVPETQEVRLWLGWNDVAHVWVNGRQLTTGKYYAVAKWEDANRPYMLANYAVLEKGWNSIAVKLERGGGNWGFGVHIVDFDNQPIEGLRVSAPHPREAVARYTPPSVGQHYRWSDVREDYLEKLPRLSNTDLAQLTGIDGLQMDPHRFMLRLPAGVEPIAGSRYITFDPNDPPEDRALNNYLNWNWEAAAALRYEKDGQTRDLVLVRPEYYAEYLSLLHERERSGESSTVAERLLGYLFITEPHYSMIPNRSPRAVLVLDARLGEYPQDDLDLLAAPAMTAKPD